MVQTIMVEVLLPATDDIVEFILPVNRRISDLLPDMVSQITAVRQNIVFDETLILCDCDRHIMLNPSWTLQEAGTKNGSRLLLC